jgi:outer membrane protein assembly factor BamB
MVFVGGKAGLGAYRLTSGECVWYSDLEANDAWSCYASPLVAEKVVVLLLPRRGMVALSRVDGSLVWETQLDIEYQYTAPLRLGDDLCSGGDRQHLARLRLADGDVVWHRDTIAGRYASGLAVDDERLYAVTPSGAIQAFDPGTGQPLWQVETGDDLLDMTPYERGGRSLLASPVRLGPWLLVGANDGVLRVLDPASGEVRAQAGLGAPITAPALPLHGDTAFLLSTWDGRLLRYESDEVAAR